MTRRRGPGDEQTHRGRTVRKNRGLVQLTLFGAFAVTLAECVLGIGLVRAKATANMAVEGPTVEFVVDEAAEPGDVLPALAELLIDIAGKG